MSTPTRNETLLLSDVLGLESLVDQITARSCSAAGGTETAILGPFWRPNAPLRPMGASLIVPPPSGGPSPASYDAEMAFLHGRVLSCAAADRKADSHPLSNATLDVSESAPHALYHTHHPDQ